MLMLRCGIRRRASKVSDPTDIRLKKEMKRVNEELFEWLGKRLPDIVEMLTEAARKKQSEEMFTFEEVESLHYSNPFIWEDDTHEHLFAEIFNYNNEDDGIRMEELRDEE